MPRSIGDDKVEAVIVTTLEQSPPDATHWSTRSLAKRVGISPASVGRIWDAFGLQPHRAESFKLSTDPFFVDKVNDVVGLYLDPPEHAVVLAVDAWRRWSTSSYSSAQRHCTFRVRMKRSATPLQSGSPT